MGVGNTLRLFFLDGGEFMNINVDPQRTIAAANSIIETAQRYMTEIEKVYSYMDDLKGSWAGEKASQFIEGVSADRAEFESFGTELKAFGEKLNEIGKDYQRLEEI